MTDAVAHPDPSPDADPTAVPTAKALREWVDDQRRAGVRRSDLNDQLYRLYVLVALVGLPVGWVVVQALDADPLHPAAQATFSQALTTWVPAGLVLVCLAGLRLGTWRGPVVFSDADIAWLLSAPIPRIGFIRPRLIRGLAWTGLLGAAVGGVVWVVLVAELEASALPLLAACMGSGALVGTLVAAGSWLVECRPGLARAVLRATPLVLVVVVGLVVVGGDAMATAALWSGPWGWASAPVLAQAGVDVPGWPVATSLLTAVTLAGVVVALRTAAVPTLEELRRRTGTAQAVATGIFWLDMGAVTGARREAISTLIGRRLRRLPVRPHRRLLVPWIGATVLLRGPWLWGRTLAMLIVAAVLGWGGATAGEDQLIRALAFAAGAATMGYVAAGALVEPIKVEVSQRFGIRHLTAAPRTILLAHLALPCALLVALAAVTAAVTAVLAGAAGMAGIAAGGVALLAPGLIATAAYGALRDPPDVTVILMYGESGMAMYATQAMLPVQGAVVITLPPVLVFAGSLAGGATPLSALGTAAAVAVAMTALAGSMLRQWLGGRA